MTSARFPWVSAAVLVAGAALYALLETAGGVTFFITPLMVGMVAVIAGLVGRNRHLIPAGLPLAGWGVGVLLIFEKTVSGSRTTPMYMLGLAAGVLVARLVAPATGRGAWFTSAAVSATAGALSLLLDYSFSGLGRWQAWCIALVAWALWELLAPAVRGRSSRPRVAAAVP
ncbi:MAG: hypothetical protein ACYC1D_01705 [Acidimicrobiales bacterium]